MCFIDLFFTNSVSVCGAVSFYPFEAWAIVYHYEVIVKTSHSPSDEPIIICGCCMQIFFRFFVCLVFFKPICLSLCIHIMFRLNEFQKPDSKNRKNFTNKILKPKNSSYECESSMMYFDLSFMNYRLAFISDAAAIQNSLSQSLIKCNYHQTNALIRHYSFETRTRTQVR